MNLNGEQILEYVPESALVIDNTAFIISTNEIFLTQYGVKRRMYTGHKLALKDLVKFNQVSDEYLIDKTLREITFTVIPSSMIENGLLAARKIGDQFILIFKDISVEVQFHSKYKIQLDELAEYSRSLEEKVKVRTKEISESNQFISGMLDSLNQAIVVIDADGNCLPHHTTNCTSIFKTQGIRTWFKKKTKRAR